MTAVGPHSKDLPVASSETGRSLHKCLVNTPQARGDEESSDRQPKQRLTDVGEQVMPMRTSWRYGCRTRRPCYRSPDGESSRALWPVRVKGPKISRTGPGALRNLRFSCQYQAAIHSLTAVTVSPWQWLYHVLSLPISLCLFGSSPIVQSAVDERAMIEAMKAGIGHTPLHSYWAEWRGDGEIALSVRLDEAGDLSPPNARADCRRRKIHMKIQPIHALTGTAVSSSGCEIISTKTGPSCSIACLNTLARSAGSATVKLFTP